MGSILSQAKGASGSIPPPRIVIHGRGGVGKTTFGASAKAPIFLCCEEGLGILEGVVPTCMFGTPPNPKPTQYMDVISALNELLNDPHEFSTLVIDTVDAMEPLVWEETCKRGSAESSKKRTYQHIEDFGYQKGYTYADEVWMEFFHALDALRAHRRMTVIALSHCHVQTVKDPQVGPYDRITPKLHTRATALLTEWADIVGYLAVKTMVTTLGDDKKPAKQVTKAFTGGERILYLEDRGGLIAKNRFWLPAEIPIPPTEPFEALRGHIIHSIRTARKPVAAAAAPVQPVEQGNAA